MMDSTINKFWKPALAVGGVAAIGAFIFYALYKQWLELQIFSALTSKDTFIVMLVFLVLVFIIVMAMLILWYLDRGRIQIQNKNGVSFSIPQGCTFEQAIRALVSEAAAVVQFEGFSKKQLKVKLTPQKISTVSTLRAIELIKGVAPQSFPKYSVIESMDEFKVSKI